MSQGCWSPSTVELLLFIADSSSLSSETCQTEEDSAVKVKWKGQRKDEQTDTHLLEESFSLF